MKRAAFLPLLAVSAAVLAACATTPKAPEPKLVAAFAETPPVGSGEDAADDPAIWVNPADASKSIIFGTDKKGGLYAYDLSGKQVQALPGGLPNNADLRQGVMLDGVKTDLMGASNREDGTLALFNIDPVTGVATFRSGTPTQKIEPYGFCIGNDAKGFIAVIPYKDASLQVWRWIDGGPKPVASWKLQGNLEAEGCVIDEENSAVFASEENVGLWRVTYSGETETGRTLVDKINSGTGLVADVEGVALWRGENGGGYVIVSSQTADRYMVYDRKAPNALRGSFRVAPSADGKIDGVSHTDGIEVLSANLGPNLPRGIFITQDDANTLPAAAQNFKFVDWREVEKALGLN